MFIKLYFDEDSMDQILIRGLKARGIDVTSAFEQNMIAKTDVEHLEYASKNGRVLFSFNRSDFYKIHTLFLHQEKSHSGIILASQQQYSAGEQMRRILRLCAVRSSEEMNNWLEFLSSW